MIDLFALYCLRRFTRTVREVYKYERWRPSAGKEAATFRQDGLGSFHIVKIDAGQVRNGSMLTASRLSRKRAK